MYQQQTTSLELPKNVGQALSMTSQPHWCFPKWAHYRALPSRRLSTFLHFEPTLATFINKNIAHLNDDLRCFETTLAYTCTHIYLSSKAIPGLAACMYPALPPMNKCFTHGCVDDGMNFNHDQPCITHEDTGALSGVGWLQFQHSSKLLDITEVVVITNQHKLRFENLEILVPWLATLRGPWTRIGWWHKQLKLHVVNSCEDVSGLHPCYMSLHYKKSTTLLVDFSLLWLCMHVDASYFNNGSTWIVALVHLSQIRAPSWKLLYRDSYVHWEKSFPHLLHTTTDSLSAHCSL